MIICLLFILNYNALFPDVTDWASMSCNLGTIPSQNDNTCLVFRNTWFVWCLRTVFWSNWKLRSVFILQIFHLQLWFNVVVAVCRRLKGSFSRFTKNKKITSWKKITSTVHEKLCESGRDINALKQLFACDAQSVIVCNYELFT